jgi:hypothetical protein
MPTFKVTVTQIVPDEELDGDDTDTNPKGTYTYEARDEEDALDQFHETVPVSCLDDFDIEAQLVKV